MSQDVYAGWPRKSFRAGDTLTAGAVLRFMTAGANAGFVSYHATDTQYIIGVALNAASATGEAVNVLLAGVTVKCNANASISAGSLVGVATDAAGRIVERGQAATTTGQVPILGIALDRGQLTNSAVEVLVQTFSANLQSA